jgi:hypothetical protein
LSVSKLYVAKCAYLNLPCLSVGLCVFSYVTLHIKCRYSDSLRAGRSGDRIPVGARFSTPVQTGPGVHPAPYTMGTGSFPRVKRPGRGLEVKERVDIPLLPFWAFVVCCSANFTFTFTYKMPKYFYPRRLHSYSTQP